MSQLEAGEMDLRKDVANPEDEPSRNPSSTEETTTLKLKNSLSKSAPEKTSVSKPKKNASKSATDTNNITNGEQSAGPPPPNAQQPQITAAPVVATPKTGLRRLPRMLEDIVAKRTQLSNERVALQRAHDDMLRLAEELNQALSNMNLAYPQMTDLDRNSKLQRNYHDMLELAKYQEQAVMDTTEALSSMEYEFTQYTARKAQVPDALSSAPSNDSLRRQFAAGAPPSETPTLLNRYFDRMGDLHIWEERLLELEYHHQLGLEQRELVRDRGDVLDVTDERFEENYQGRKAHYVGQIQAIEKDCRDLELLCQKQGLVTEEVKNQHSSIESESGESSERAQMQREMLPDAQIIKASRPGSSFQPPWQQQRVVKDWLESVDPNAISSIREGGSGSSTSNSRNSMVVTQERSAALANLPEPLSTMTGSQEALPSNGSTDLSGGGAGAELILPPYEAAMPPRYYGGPVIEGRSVDSIPPRTSNGPLDDPASQMDPFKISDPANSQETSAEPWSDFEKVSIANS
jgi:hypothetical protein